MPQGFFRKYHSSDLEESLNKDTGCSCAAGKACLNLSSKNMKVCLYFNLLSDCKSIIGKSVYSILSFN